MKVLVRGIFGALAALVLFAQVTRTETDAQARPPPDPAGVLAAFGLRPAASTLPDTLAALAPDCPQPVTLVRVDFNGLGQAAARSVLALPGAPRFVYLGAVGTQADAVSIAARWAAASLLRVLGLRAGEVSREVVLVMLPASCPRLAGLDWSKLSPWS